MCGPSDRVAGRKFTHKSAVSATLCFQLNIEMARGLP
jgi:hypothetical protein